MIFPGDYKNATKSPHWYSLQHADRLRIVDLNPCGHLGICKASSERSRSTAGQAWSHLCSAEL